MTRRFMPRQRNRPTVQQRLSAGWEQLQRLFRAYEAEESDARRFRARQLEALLRLTPLAMGSNVLNAVVIDVSLWHKGFRPWLLAWSFVIATLTLLGLRGWWRARGSTRETASRRAMRRAGLHAGALGATWGVFAAILLPRLDAGGQLHLATIVIGMICAGGFALSSVPHAATMWVATAGIGAVVALWNSGIEQAHLFALLLCAYCLLVIYTAWAMAKVLGARLMAEAHAARQGEVIGLLLKDFEDHASDLLWELDGQGRFVHVSPRLSQMLGVPTEMFARAHAWAVIRRRMPRDDSGAMQWAALRAHLVAARGFRDLHVSLVDGGRLSWWALSARPLVDEQGRVTGWRGVAADITERQIAHRRLTWLANNDSLTGLMNRHQFREHLAGLLAPVTGLPAALAVIYLDLDDFKRVNDTRGHAAGDLMLTAFGQRLLSVARRTDTVARLGGDEFAMVVRNTAAPEELRPVLERIVGSLATPVDIMGESEFLRASIGVALAPLDGTDTDTLLNHADLALYAAKQAGGNRYAFFEAGLAEVSRRRLALAQALRGACERGELRLVYQPQISTRDQQVCGFEALLRWTSAEYGDVAPAEFIPIAESTGLLPAIGDWVLRTACVEAQRWPRHVSLAVNVSASQLTAPGFAAQLADAAAPLRPGRLELEVTESVLMDDAAEAMATLRSVRAMGFRTALDDFGTGYSALAYLRRFPFDTLKIDRTFVRDLASDGEAEVLVDTMIAMARAMGMRTVAEGVQQHAEGMMLSQRGCTAYQGFLVSPPLEADEIPRFLLRWQRGEVLHAPPAALPHPIPAALH